MVAPSDGRKPGAVLGHVNGCTNGLKYRAVSTASTASSTVSTSPQLQSDMHKLQEDIAQRTEELLRLQNLAKSVRTPGYPAKFSTGVQPNESNARGLGLEISGNAEQKPRKEPISPHSKTTKVIEGLQSTIDALKRNLHHERTSRDADTKLIAALNKRLESTGAANDRLSQQMTNYDSMASRKTRRVDESERALKVERDKCAQKHAEVQTLREKVDELCKEVARERGKREYIENAYNTLRRATGEKSQTTITQMKREMKQLHAQRSQDCADIQRLSELLGLQKTENATLTKVSNSMKLLHEEQKVAIASLVDIVHLHVRDTGDAVEVVA